MDRHKAMLLKPVLDVSMGAVDENFPGIFATSRWNVMLVSRKALSLVVNLLASNACPPELGFRAKSEFWR
ncbi:hypothetical protein B6V76_03615 [Thioclava sp. IC9]|nr:hypothetical protein B6V76_03615 [Thioclava sp. IC9]